MKQYMAFYGKYIDFETTMQVKHTSITLRMFIFIIYNDIKNRKIIPHMFHHNIVFYCISSLIYLDVVRIL